VSAFKEGAIKGLRSASKGDRRPGADLPEWGKEIQKSCSTWKETSNASAKCAKKRDFATFGGYRHILVRGLCHGRQEGGAGGKAEITEKKKKGVVLREGDLPQRTKKNNDAEFHTALAKNMSLEKKTGGGKTLKTLIGRRVDRDYPVSKKKG